MKASSWPFFACMSSLLIFIGAGCGPTTDNPDIKQGACTTIIKAHLNMIELYQTNHGRFPATLSEAYADDPGLFTTNVVTFNYNPAGVINLQGTNWIISATNPANQSELILGRLPNQILIYSQKK